MNTFTSNLPLASLREKVIYFLLFTGFFKSWFRCFLCLHFNDYKKILFVKPKYVVLSSTVEDLMIYFEYANVLRQVT